MANEEIFRNVFLKNGKEYTKVSNISIILDLQMSLGEMSLCR